MNRELDAARLTALLRVVAVPVLLVGEVYIAKPEPTERAFLVVLAAFAVYAVATFIIAGRLERAQLALVGLDIAFAGALSYTSGGGYSQLRLAFLFPIVTAAFICRPHITATVTITAISVYALQALAHPSARLRGDERSFILVQVVYIAWIGAALSLLSLLLERRERAITTLSRQRQRLVAEVYGAEERERKRLAEDLHDHAIQNLLAARHALNQPARANPSGPEALAVGVIGETVAQLRAAVSDLHPHLLDQAGLMVALAAVARRSSARGDFALALDLDDAEPGPNDRVLLRSATELLVNIERHAHAAHARVGLGHIDGADRLQVSDDGTGFDPADLSTRLRPGHIGLLSLKERAEALGGSLVIESSLNSGTRATLTLPRVEGDE